MITHQRERLSLKEERTLVAAAQAGDKESLHTLIEAHYQQMYHLAMKTTRDPVKAQDVTQEACVQVLRRIDQFRLESRFSSWVGRIVVNSALLAHRREKRLVPTDQIFSSNAACSAPLPEDQVSQRDLLDKTDLLLKSLRSGDRELFIKRFIDGLSLQSISEETGLSLPALKSRFHRARLRLKDVSTEQNWGLNFAD